MFQEENLKIKRINSYEDGRFSRKVLLQHGCYLVNEAPYEVEIISESEAIIRGKDREFYPALIEEFRFNAPQITCFYDSEYRVIKKYRSKEILTIPLEDIQPSQFYVDEEKLSAVSDFIQKAEDIIIQVLPDEDRYISLDGHTRLYYAVLQGWKHVRAVTEVSDDWVYGFVEEARKRGIREPKDMIMVSHEEYEKKWIGFCDEYFSRNA